jgi:hypothetical protein
MVVPCARLKKNAKGTLKESWANSRSTASAYSRFQSMKHSCGVHHLVLEVPMSSSRFIPMILLAGLLAASACSDSTAPTTQPGILAPTAAAPVTLYGVISKTGRDPMHGLVLTLEDGSEVPLVFNVETSALSSLGGAGVEIRGNWDSDQAFEVGTFFVRQIGGAAVLDGVLLEERTQDAEDIPVIAYRLQPSDGSVAQAINPSQEMLQHLGTRMWVRLDETGNAAEFGIIGQ